MERGYVKMWRKTLDSPIFKNPELFCFWSWCLMKASHKKYKVLVGLTMVELEPGQFVFGRLKASTETGLSERKVRTCLKKLKNFENLTIKTTNKFSIISIINWDTYQQDKPASDQQSDQQVTNNRPTSDQQVTTNKNNKHIKNKEKNIYTSNFLLFWELYPKKVGKGFAFKAYKNINDPKPTLSEIKKSIEEHQKIDQWSTNQFIPNPATWLNQRRWEDELQHDNQETDAEYAKRMGYA